MIYGDLVYHTVNAINSPIQYSVITNPKLFFGYPKRCPKCDVQNIDFRNHFRMSNESSVNSCSKIRESSKSSPKELSDMSFGFVRKPYIIAILINFQLSVFISRSKKYSYSSLDTNNNNTGNQISQSVCDATLFIPLYPVFRRKQKSISWI